MTNLHKKSDAPESNTFIYIWVSRNIELTKNTKKWALKVFSRKGATTDKLISNKDASILHQIKKDESN